MKLSTMAVGIVLLGTMPAAAEDLQKLKIVLFTDQDDKDDDEEVTIEIIRTADGKVAGSQSFGRGETWGDQTEQRLELRLKSPMPSADKGKYSIKVSKSCAKGYANGKGWHFCVRAVSGVDDKNDEYKVRGRETGRVLLGKQRGTTGPTSIDFELAD